MSVNNALRKRYLVTTACFVDRLGLISGQGYIVKDYLQVRTPEGQKIRLLKIKNPWRPIGDPSSKDSSHGEWTGPYSNSDKKSWNPQLKKLAKFDKLKSGEFYMTYEDFKDSFKYYTITYLHKNFKTSFIEKRSSINQRLYKFNFTLEDEDDYSNFLKINKS